MGITAIIPARGGSKGIPRKNVQSVAGKTLIARAVETAKSAKSVDRVFVTTDDAEISREARTHGAEVIKRPSEISGDEASSESALLHALRKLRENEEYIPDRFAFIQCTSPLLLTEDIDGAIEKHQVSDADVVFSATQFDGFLWRYVGNDFKGINHDSDRRLRRQNRESQYLETGGVYVIRKAGFVEYEHRFFGKILPYEVPLERSVDIDQPVDLEIAEQILRNYERSKRLEKLPDSLEALVLDFDGVFTDNKVHVDQGGGEMVVCHRGDGWGISQLKEKNFPVWVLSTEENPVVQKRCDKLDLPCVHGTQNKKNVLRSWLDDEGIEAQDIVFLGNDINDVKCLHIAGCGAVVKDAHPDVQSSANLILSKSGGEGAVREITDLILRKLKS